MKVVTMVSTIYMKENVDINAFERVPDFIDVPEWANYLAQDYNGAWFFYAEEPTPGNGYWKNQEGTQYKVAIINKEYCPCFEDRRSLDGVRSVRAHVIKRRTGGYLRVLIVNNNFHCLEEIVWLDAAIATGHVPDRSFL